MGFLITFLLVGFLAGLIARARVSGTLQVADNAVTGTLVQFVNLTTGTIDARSDLLARYGLAWTDLHPR